MNIFTYLRLSAIVLCSFIFTESYAQKEEDYFITVWDLSLVTNTTNELSFWALTTGDVAFSWESMPAGKSGSGKFTADGKVIIPNLPVKATIKLKLAPQNLKRFYFSFSSFNHQLLNVQQWGKVAWSSMEQAFLGSRNLNITATDLPNLEEVKSLRGMFYDCIKLEGPTNIGLWNVDNITDMAAMFADATSFNQPIGNWNTQKVSDMNSMFSNASFFNQPIDNWKTQNVTTMRGMFQNAQSFNQKLENWQLNLIELLALDRCGMDCQNYSNTLVGWANNPNTPSNLGLGSAGLKYNTLAEAARDKLTKPEAQGGKGWTILGDELSNEACGIITGQENAIEKSTITLYPNPAQEKLFLKNAEANSAYKIIDNLGRTLTSGICQNEEIAIGALPSGLYKLVSGNKYFTFVKE